MTEPDAGSMLEHMPEALLVEEGKIKASGSFQDMSLLDPAAVKHDLDGACLMPSFMDGHGHCCWNGKTQITVNLSSCRCHQDIIDALKKYIEINRPTPDITVFADNYDPKLLAEHTHPDRRILDQASDVIPIQATHVSGHVGCANSPCLKQAGIDENTPDPEGGFIERLPGTTIPSGFLEETAFDAVRQSTRPHFKPDLTIMAEKMQSSYIRNGITTIQDGNSVDGEFTILRGMAERKLLKVDTVSYLSMPLGGEAVMHRDIAYAGDYINHLRIGGYKLIMDGSVLSRTAFLSKPYEGETEYCGRRAMPDEEIHRYMTTALTEGRQLLGHCIGDGTSDQLIRVYRQVLKETGISGDLRTVMIHCCTLRPDQIKEMKSLGMYASVYMPPYYHQGNTYRQVLGEERFKAAMPAGKLCEAGINVTLHQDTPIQAPNMLESIWIAANRIDTEGNSGDADQCMPVYEALKANTVYTARQYFEENRKGTLEAGKLADLMILNKNPLEVAKEEIRNIKVLETIKEGETLYRLQ